MVNPLEWCDPLGLTEADHGVDVTKSAADRASEIHKAVPEGTQRRTTNAVTETQEGVRVVSSSEKRLRPAQRKLLGKNEVEGVGLGHAETTKSTEEMSF